MKGLVLFFVVSFGLLANASDRDLLVDLYNTLDGPNWPNKYNWNSTYDISTWTGVQCSGDGNVVYLELASNNLKGNLPKSFSNFKYLETVDLEANQDLKGDIAIFAAMPNLRKLTLSRTGITISDAVGNFPKLELLYLQDVPDLQQKGSPPSGIGKISTLTHLDISSNAFSGYLPEWVGDLPLTVLYIDRNNFGGLIPDNWHKLAATLEYFRFSDLPLTPADIPYWLKQCHNLKYLDMRNSQRTGTVDDGLFTLHDLNDLDLSNNHLTGELNNTAVVSKNWKVFHLGDNQFTGDCPHWADSNYLIDDCDLHNIPFSCPINYYCLQFCKARCTLTK